MGKLWKKIKEYQGYTGIKKGKKYIGEKRKKVNIKKYKGETEKNRGLKRGRQRGQIRNFKFEMKGLIKGENIISIQLIFSKC